jgi:hypothetical protein
LSKMIKDLMLLLFACSWRGRPRVAAGVARPCYRARDVGVLVTAEWDLLQPFALRTCMHGPCIWLLHKVGCSSREPTQPRAHVKVWSVRKKMREPERE